MMFKGLKLSFLAFLIVFYANFAFAVEPKVAAGGDGVTASHSLAILPDGSLWAWGDNSSGQLGIGYTGGFVTVPTRVGTDTDWVDIAAGYKFSLALKSDGTLWAWGYNISGQLGDGTGITSGKDKPIKIPIFGIDLDSQTKVKSFAAWILSCSCSYRRWQTLGVGR